MIVEDEPELRQLLASYLINDGYDVIEAEDGVTAISLFGSEKIDLVILDIMIPKIDGYGVCEFVKKKSNVPVIFLSALDDEKSMVKGYDSLADDYVTKPFSMPVFLRKVKATLRLSSSTSAEECAKVFYKDIEIIPDMAKVMVGGKDRAYYKRIRYSSDSYTESGTCVFERASSRDALGLQRNRG